MKLFPAAAPVLAVERRLAHSKRQLHQQLNQTRSTLNWTPSQPLSLLIATGIGTVLGIWLARGKTAIVTSIIASIRPVVRSLLITLLVRFLLQRMTHGVARSGAGEKKAND